VALRKKWQTRFVGRPRRHASQAATYRYIEELRQDWGLGAISVRQLTVWVDEGDGRGFQLYERVDLGIPAGTSA
jgi:hypothetical protein